MVLVASERKYKCPFCNKTYPRSKLAHHIDKYHYEMLNEDNGYTSNRIVFDICNNKEPIGAGHGTCRICKKDTTWNESTVRYNAYCSDKCKDIAVENYRKNMLKVYGKTTLLNDPEHQKKMLDGRSISGKYRWSDGTYKTYTGSYELKLLEFADNVLQLDSSDFITPGPTISYMYNGKEHFWITDAIYLPYNMCIDVKDGKDNPNTREMKEYREKQIQKEKFITDQGEYSYLRLTDNDFSQLLTIMAELKESYMDNNEPKTISRIHEHTAPMGISGIAPGVGTDNMPSLFISNIMNKNTFESIFGISNDITSDYMLIREKDTGKLKKKKTKDLLKEYDITNTYKYIGNDTIDILRELYSVYKHEQYIDPQYLPCILTEFDQVLSDDQLDYSDMLQLVDKEYIQEAFYSTLATIQYQSKILMENKKPIVFNILDPVKYEYKKELLREYEDLTILQGINGEYFAYNTINCKRTKSVDSIYEINETMLKSISANKGGN